MAPQVGVISTDRFSSKGVTITSDLKKKQFKYRDEVPKSVLEDQFDHVDEDDGFFKYNGWWYHTSDFMRTNMHGWHGSIADSAWTGVLIWLSKDGETYIVGSFRS